MRCGLEDIRRSEWGPPEPVIMDQFVWLGRSPEPDDASPREDLADGCPGAWWQAGFPQSFLRYRRLRAEGGVRVDNPLISPASRPLILEALAFYERQEEAAEAEFWRKVNPSV